MQETEFAIGIALGAELSAGKAARRQAVHLVFLAWHLNCKQSSDAHDYE